MAAEGPKRGRGRPRKEGSDKPLSVTLPRHHFDYLTFLALRKHRLGTSAKEVAEHILIRELDAMFMADYHLKEIPAD
jgi:hypothetical protein